MSLSIWDRVRIREGIPLNICLQQFVRDRGATSCSICEWTEEKIAREIDFTTLACTNGDDESHYATRVTFVMLLFTPRASTSKAVPNAEKGLLPTPKDKEPMKEEL